MSHGASISVTDPRVSRAIAWGMGVFGSAVVLIGAWIATSINSLNVNMAKVVTQIETSVRRVEINDARDDRQDVQINQIQRDVAVIEGKTFRGGVAKELPHGN